MNQKVLELVSDKANIKHRIKTIVNYYIEGW